MMNVSLVLLPGLDGTGDLFHPFISKLSPQLQLVVVSYPTHGAQDYATLVQFVLEQLPTDRSFVLLGESFSGPVAILVAAAGPKNLAGIILCASFIASPRRLARLFARLSRVAPLHLLARVGGPHFLMGRFKTRALSRVLVRAVAKVSRQVLSERYSSVANVDVRTEFSNLRIPILYLRASEDVVVPASVAKSLVKTNVRAKVEVIEAPHFLLQCAPVRSANIVEGFVRDVSSAA